MRLAEARFLGFKRFTDLRITGIPSSAKLVVLAGPNGSGKSSIFDGFRTKRPTQQRYPAELHDRGVRMVLDEFERSGERHGVVTRIAAQLGVGTESLRKWVKQTEVDGGRRPGVSSADQQRISALEKEKRELPRANEILKAASTFFARELDPRLPK